jgi:hypothetical protein
MLTWNVATPHLNLTLSSMLKERQNIEKSKEGVRMLPENGVSTILIV